IDRVGQGRRRQQLPATSLPKFPQPKLFSVWMTLALAIELAKSPVHSRYFDSLPVESPVAEVAMSHRSIARLSVFALVLVGFVLTGVTVSFAVHRHAESRPAQK